MLHCCEEASQENTYIPFVSRVSPGLHLNSTAIKDSHLSPLLFSYGSVLGHVGEMS